ncbi:MAG TPA: SDR family oxidoreductase [Solirubrobacterales bacterium]|nr:SDR family oxidoreductase [Solirubrobacterales bacterium]
MDVRGARTLLTGATGGLGRAIATALADRGSTLVLSSRKPEELEELATELPGEGHEVLVSELGSEGAGEELAAKATESGRIDIFVANAGLPGTGRLEELDPEWITRVLHVNLEAPIHATRALLPAMLERGAGHFVFVSSLAGKTPSPRSSMYNASKFGLRGFALALRQDVRGSGVGASLVLPGFIRDAGMFADAEMDPPPGMGTGTPEQVGAAVLRAIEDDRAEIVVAPPQQRALTAVAHTFPRVAALAQRGQGEKIAEDLASRQSDKR